MASATRLCRSPNLSPLQATLQAVGGEATLLSVRNAGHALVSHRRADQSRLDQVNAATVERLGAKPHLQAAESAGVAHPAHQPEQDR
ncbi:hypothetical protein [Candidatus Amarolinea dominans]|uniref:hypothetical protein n=1 Tax=Candidatus Amarolinea dominans TaxID=3140696 RepID=UPI0031347020|nr:hypothetical protein [Anaerolineae bacterium]